MTKEENIKCKADTQHGKTRYGAIVEEGRRVIKSPKGVQGGNEFILARRRRSVVVVLAHDKQTKNKHAKMSKFPASSLKGTKKLSSEAGNTMDSSATLGGEKPHLIP